MECGIVCSCENGHETSGFMKSKRFLDKQSTVSFSYNKLLLPLQLVCNRCILIDSFAAWQQKQSVTEVEAFCTREQINVK